jgi:hypothetical protein
VGAEDRRVFLFELGMKFQTVFQGRKKRGYEAKKWPVLSP